MNCRISRSLIARISKEARKSPHREICGLLLGIDHEIVDVSSIPNVAPMPQFEFELDRAKHVMTSRIARDRGLMVLGHYHSHPGGNPVPSVVDAGMGDRDGTLWLIIAGGEQRLWRSLSGGPILGAFAPMHLVVDTTTRLQQGNAGANRGPSKAPRIDQGGAISA